MGRDPRPDQCSLGMVRAHTQPGSARPGEAIHNAEAQGCRAWRSGTDKVTIVDHVDSRHVAVATPHRYLDTTVRSGRRHGVVYDIGQQTPQRRGAGVRRPLLARLDHHRGLMPRR